METIEPRLSQAASWASESKRKRSPSKAKTSRGRKNKARKLRRTKTQTEKADLGGVNRCVMAPGRVVGYTELGGASIIRAHARGEGIRSMKVVVRYWLIRKSITNDRVPCLLLEQPELDSGDRVRAMTWLITASGRNLTMGRRRALLAF